jgi:DNA polymerase III epsilon subunit-like protein
MISLDVESSGLDPRMCSIVSIGAVDTDDPTNQFYDECRIWEGADINDDALEVNGFTREELLDEGGKKTEAELIRDFVAWATDRPENRTLLAQNVPFDLGFVQQACKRAGIESPFAHRALDLHTLCWMHMAMRGEEPPTSKHRTAINLTYVLNHCGLPEEPSPHNALTGALCHAEAFSRMAYNQKLLPDFSTFDIPWTSETLSAN